MAVFRIERTRDYTVMSNHHLRNGKLSLKAKGLLSMMLSLPDDWNYTTRGLAKICKEGVDAIGNELSAKIKVAEKRMAEIAVLRTHIINYAKTRDTYVAYRKAGYSKKFREEHEEEILLHQAAKNAFDDMGVKKLPKVKELQAEYARLLDEKKKTYAEYRRSREEMRELLAAKANVDRLLSMEAEHDTEREKDHGQR